MDFPPLLFLSGSHILPVAQGFSLKPTSDFIFLFRFTSYGSKARTDTRMLAFRNSGAVQWAFRTHPGCAAGTWIWWVRSPSGPRCGAGGRWLPPPPRCPGPGRAGSWRQWRSAGAHPSGRTRRSPSRNLAGRWSLCHLQRAAWKRRPRWSSGDITKNGRAGARMTFLHFVTQHVDLRLPSAGTSVLVQASDLQLWRRGGFWWVNEKNN